jgi:hypothetical protein
MDTIYKVTWWKKWRKAILLGIVLVSGIGAIFWSVLMYMFTSSFAYREALLRVNANSYVTSLVGAPIESGYFITGSVNESGPSGSASLTIPIHGSKDEATLYVVAEKSVGLWTLNALVVELDKTKQRINLLESRTQ